MFQEFLAECDFLWKKKLLQCLFFLKQFVVVDLTIVKLFGSFNVVDFLRNLPTFLCLTVMNTENT